MSAITAYDWSNPSGGDFNTPTNWSGGVVPGSGNDADLVALGAPYTVQDTYSSTLKGLQTAAGTTLVTSGQENVLTLTQGTDGGVSAGTVRLGDFNALEVAGTFTNTGTISVDSVTHPTGIGLLSTAIFNGGGQILLSDAKGSYGPTNFFIAQYGPGTQLVNVDNTISGAGNIGAYSFSDSTMPLTNDSAGVIDADGVNPLIIDTGATVTNAGLMEVTGSGGLILLDSIYNTGALAGMGGTQFATLAIDGAVTLTGGGIVILNAKGVIAGDGPATLTNVDNTIIGAGFITASNTGSITGSLNLSNGADGVIDASTGRLEIMLPGSTVTNAGLIEATGAGSLLIKNTTITNTGTVTSGKAIELASSTIAGGTVMVVAGGVLKNAGASTISGYVANAGTIGGGVVSLTITGDVSNSGLLVANKGDLTITGAVTGSGQARIAGGGVLEVDGALGEKVTFADSGPGTLVLGDSADLTGIVYGFSKTGANQIELRDIAYDAADTVAYSTKTHAITVDNAQGTVLATISLKNSYAGSTFILSRGADNGTVITDPRAVTFASAAAGFGASPPAQAAASPLQASARLAPLVHA